VAFSILGTGDLRGAHAYPLRLLGNLPAGIGLVLDGRDIDRANLVGALGAAE
jgi:hypothetical protein